MISTQGLAAFFMLQSRRFLLFNQEIILRVDTFSNCLCNHQPRASALKKHDENERHRSARHAVGIERARIDYLSFGNGLRASCLGYRHFLPKRRLLDALSYIKNDSV